MPNGQQYGAAENGGAGAGAGKGVGRNRHGKVVRRAQQQREALKLSGLLDDRGAAVLPGPHAGSGALTSESSPRTSFHVQARATHPKSLAGSSLEARPARKGGLAVVHFEERGDG